MPDRSSLSEGRSRPSVDIIIAAPGWRGVLPERIAERAVLAACEGGVTGHITVLLADDRTLKALNTQHRGKEKPTNVLSFPGLEHGSGDIAISLQTVKREAGVEGKRPRAHAAHLVAHGTLHLLGHDHLEAGEARRMERAESRAMHRLRLPNPWNPSGGRAA